MLQTVSRHNLSEDLVTGDSLPIPALPGPADTLQPADVAQVSCDWWMVMIILTSDWSRQFLKLILGVAVTCSNKLLFISKIQSLDETTQHALTACIVSFISTKVGNSSDSHSVEFPHKITSCFAQDWTEKASAADPAPSPASGEEVWAQKCHELDYQVRVTCHVSLVTCHVSCVTCHECCVTASPVCRWRCCARRDPTWSRRTRSCAGGCGRPR